jgi:SAM-dependent methyltransferase
MNFTNALQAWSLIFRSSKAAKRAANKGLQGLEFFNFGRRLGWHLLASGSRAGLDYVITPVKNLRYFEFPFVFESLPAFPGKWLDVSSPSLLSLYVAKMRPSCHINIINPDINDLSETKNAAAKLRLKNVVCGSMGVDSLEGSQSAFDCIWSISVVEHIYGAYDDTAAMRWMFEALKPGGRLIVTVPVDKQPRDEYRETDYYGTQTYVSGKGFFFQRIYDKSSVHERLIDSLKCQIRRFAWYGEISRGHFGNYVDHWMKGGFGYCAEDPLVMAANYQQFPSWENMAGFGVCGFVLEKCHMADKHSQ